MTDRRRYLVAYDIRDPRRLRKVLETCKAFGEHLQYSVFLCDLDGTEKPLLMEALGRIIDARADEVVFVDLGEIRGRGNLCFEFLGRVRRMPRTGARIV